MKEKPTTFELAQLAAQVSTPLADSKGAIRKALELWREAEAEIHEREDRTEYLHNLFRTPNGKDIPIFSDIPEIWLNRLKAYPGDQREVERAMWDQKFPVEEVQKQLYRDKSLSRGTRQQLFLGLVKAAIHYNMEGPLVSGRGRLEYLGTVDGEFIKPREGFPIHPKNLECAEEHYRKVWRGVGKMLIPAKEVRFVDEITALLSAPALNAFLVRWLVEVRQRQLEVAKSRVIPASLKEDHDERDTDENIQVKRPRRQ